MLEEPEQSNRLNAFDIYPVELVDSISTMQQTLPKISKLREHDIRKKVKPTEILDRLRISFWVEYQKAFRENRRMRVEKIYASICTKRYFLEVAVTDKYQLLWLITQPHSYNLEMRRIAQNSLFEISQKLDKLATGGPSNRSPSSTDEMLKILEWVYIHAQY